MSVFLNENNTPALLNNSDIIIEIRITNELCNALEDKEVFSKFEEVFCTGVVTSISWYNDNLEAYLCLEDFEDLIGLNQRILDSFASSIEHISLAKKNKKIKIVIMTEGFPFYLELPYTIDTEKQELVISRIEAIPVDKKTGIWIRKVEFDRDDSIELEIGFKDLSKLESMQQLIEQANSVVDEFLNGVSVQFISGDNGIKTAIVLDHLNQELEVIERDKTGGWKLSGDHVIHRFFEDALQIVVDSVRSDD